MIQKYAGITCGCLAALLCALPAAAQNTNKFGFNVGGGFTEPVKQMDGRLNTGFNLNAGAGVNFTPYLGIMGEFGFNDLGLSPSTLATEGVPSGTSRIYSVTLNPIVRFHPHGRFDAYVIGGGGFYRRTVEFTQPAVANVPFFDPFLGGFVGVPVATNQVLASFSQNKAGLNIGGGIEVRVRGDSNAKFYAESRYHYIFTTPVRTTVVPVTFGFRW